MNYPRHPLFSLLANPSSLLFIHSHISPRSSTDLSPFVFMRLPPLCTDGISYPQSAQRFARSLTKTTGVGGAMFKLHFRSQTYSSHFRPRRNPSRMCREHPIRMRILSERMELRRLHSGRFCGTKDLSVNPVCNHKTPKPRRMCRSVKPPCNPFGMCSYKTKDLKSFRISTYEKKKGGGYRTARLSPTPVTQASACARLRFPAPEDWNKIMGWAVRRALKPSAATKPNFPAEAFRVFCELYPLYPEASLKK